MLLFLCLISFIVSPIFGERPTISGDRYYILSGKDGNEGSFDVWDRYYNRTTSYVYGKNPSKFLSENYEYITGQKVLDIGMGEGRNAVFLATKGYQVTGIDISKVALRKAVTLASESNVRITPVHSSIEKFSGGKEEYSAVLCFYFLPKEMNEKIISFIRPGGLLIIETFLDDIKNKKEFKFDNFSKSYLVKSQELLSMFPKMKILKYEETINEEYRASIILQKAK